MCSFSRDGQYIAAGGNDCNCYVWQWEFARGAQQGAGCSVKLQTQQCGGIASEHIQPSHTQLEPSLPGSPSQPHTIAEGSTCDQLPPSARAAAVADGSNDATTEARGASFGAASPAAAAQQTQADAAQESSAQHNIAARSAVADAQAAYVAAQAAVAVSEVTIGTILRPNQWPVPREVCRLEGHRNDVPLLMFSPDSTTIATGSKDGLVRVRLRN